MNKQPRMIDKDKLLKWIDDKLSKEFPQSAAQYADGRQTILTLLEGYIEDGLFDPDPIPLPTIKPGEVDTDGYSDKNIGFVRGVAYAAGLIKQYDTDSDQLIQESGITEEVLRKYADDYDLGNLGLLEGKSNE